MRLGPAKRPRWILPVVAVLLASPLLDAAAEPETLEAQGPRLSETREAPGSGVVNQTAPQPAREPAFELVGVVKREGDASFALLQEPELMPGKPVLIRQGQSIGAYRLVAVERDRVRLDSAAGVITVLLGGSRGSSGAVALVPPPAPVAGQAPNVLAELPPHPSAPEPQGGVSPESRATAEDSVAAALKGTQGEKVLNMFKNAFGLGAKQ